MEQFDDQTQEQNITPENRKARYIDPEDPLGSINLLLEEYGWTKMPMVDREQHARWEESDDPKDKEMLALFERNMHRMNNLHQLYAIFDSVEEFLPNRVGYYRERIQEINNKYIESGVASGDSQKPVPFEIVFDCMMLITEYKKELIEAKVHTIH